MSASKAKCPTISITADKAHHTSSESSDGDTSSNDNDMDYNFSGGATDVEDLNSQGDGDSMPKPRARRSSSANVLAPASANKVNRDNDVTDIEDYNDSDSDDDEKSSVYPELKLSLQEFLEHGLQEQAILNNGVQEKVEVKAGDFIQAQNLNGTSDYLTDCEDYDTDSDIEWGCEKSVCLDLDKAVDDQGKVCIADAAHQPTLAREESDDNEDVSVFSDISDMASALSDATGVEVRGMSENELFEMSGSEEVCQIAYSGSSDTDEDEHIAKFVAKAYKMPAIDVTFIAANQLKLLPKANTPLMSTSSSFLDIAQKTEEVLTDVEGLEDSAAEEEDSFDSEDGNEKPIPRAVILAAGDDGGCVTDVEDVFCEDGCIFATEPLVVALQALPVPHREIIVLREDKFGDTITSVEPMNDHYQFGIYNNKDDVPTDSEEYSCGDDFERRPSLAEELLSTSNLIEGEVTILNEVFKPALNKRVELHSNAESITDVEEIYVAGTNRRKKIKTRSISGKGPIVLKNKFLDVNRQGGQANKEDYGGTDIEDMDFSEAGLPANVNRNEISLKRQNSALSTTDKVTDVEDLTADDSISDISGVEAPYVDINAAGLKQYIADSANVVLTLEKDGTCAKKYTKQLTTLQLKRLQDEEGGSSSQQHTDIEDIQMPSDVEETFDSLSCNANSAKICNCSSRELSDMLNESYTVVHEKSGSAFNMDAEKLHIKDVRDLRDAYTDVEYMESDESAARGGN